MFHCFCGMFFKQSFANFSVYFMSFHFNNETRKNFIASNSIFLERHKLINVFFWQILNVSVCSVLLSNGFFMDTRLENCCSCELFFRKFQIQLIVVHIFKIIKFRIRNAISFSCSHCIDAYLMNIFA